MTRSAARIAIALVALLAIVPILWLALRRTGTAAGPAPHESIAPAPSESASSVVAEPERVEVAAPAPQSASPAEELEPAPAPAPEPRFRGRVVEDETGRAVAGARIRSADTEEIREFATSDENGAFEVPLGEKTYFARVDAAGYSLAYFAVGVGAASTGSAYEIRLSRSATLDVRVRDANSPLAEAQVEISAHPYELSRGIGSTWSVRDPMWRSTCDASGRAVIDELPASAPLKVRVRVTKRASPELPELTLAPGELRELEVVFGSGCVVRGHLRDRSGAPIAGYPILCVRGGDEPHRDLLVHTREQKPVATAEDGSFAFESVAPGTWNVGPVHFEPKDPRDPHVAGLSELVQIAPDASEVEVELVADRNLFIEGVVLGPDGTPAANAYVTAHHFRQDTFANVDANAASDGSFRIGPLFEGEWELTARAARALSGPGESKPVAASAGSSGIVLRLRGAGDLTGTVIELASGERRAAKISVAEIAEDVRRIAYVEAVGGAFETRGLVEGRYAVAAISEDGLVGRRVVEIRAGETADVRIELVPGAKLVLAYEGEAERAGFMVRANGELVAFGAVARGEHNEVAVPGEPLVVAWREVDPVRTAQRDVTLAVGETRELVWDGAP